MDTGKIILDKYGILKENILSLGKTAVAFSGGVDSAFLLYAAKDALGENVIALTASTAAYPEREIRSSKEFCDEYGIRQIIFDPHELEIEGFADNPENRCYICKSRILQQMRKIARDNGITEVLEGSNTDDDNDFRPGHRAVAEQNVRSPLREADFSKEEIRIMSKELGLKTWDKKSYACLYTRFPYGDRLSRKKIGMVDEAEQFLIDLGFEQVRVRVHDNIARIEIEPDGFERFLESGMRIRIHEKLKEIGFSYSALDLIGYRTGSMNEAAANDRIINDV